MIGSRHELARFQSDFYRDCYRKTVTALIVCVAIMLLLISSIAYVFLTRAKPQYYATTTNGQIIPMTPNKSSRP